MGAVDKETRAYLSKAIIFADAFNFKLYGGRQVIRPDDLRELDTAEVAMPYGNDAKEPVQRFRDVLKLYAAMQDDEAIYLVLGIESQTRVHYAMPVRNMLYDAMNYARQVAKAAESYRKSDTKLTNEEFLSGFRKEDRLMPVITLVINFAADSWDGAMSLHEMLAVKNSELLAFVPDYRLNMISPADIDDSDFDKFQTGLGAVMQFIKHCSDKDVDWLSGNKRFEELDRESASLIKTVTGADIHFDEKGDSVNMWKAWENSMQQARIDGMKASRPEMWKAWENSVQQARIDGMKASRPEMWKAWENSVQKAESDGYVRGDKAGYTRGDKAGYERGQASILRQLMQRNGLSSSQAMDMAGISSEERPRYQVLLDS